MKGIFSAVRLHNEGSDGHNEGSDGQILTPGNFRLESFRAGSEKAVRCVGPLVR